MLYPLESFLLRWGSWLVFVPFLLTILALIVFFVLRAKEHGGNTQSDDNQKDFAFVNIPLSRCLFWFASTTFLLTIFALIVFAFTLAREAARNAACRSNQKYFACSIFWYYDHYGHLPPAHVDALDGSRMHSWRTLACKTDFPIPYDFSEPWNGPNNSKLGDKRYDQFACPNDLDTQRNKRLTNYFVIEGANTPFPGTRTRSIANAQDFKSRSNTILVAEAIGLGIEWLEPRDLNYDEMSFMINDSKRPSISSPHPAGPAACMADGSVQTLNPNISPEILKTMLNIQQDAWRPGVDKVEKQKEEKTSIYEE